MLIIKNGNYVFCIKYLLYLLLTFTKIISTFYFTLLLYENTFKYNGPILSLYEIWTPTLAWYSIKLLMNFSLFTTLNQIK